jgi:hypothetical protein
MKSMCHFSWMWLFLLGISLSLFSCSGSKESSVMGLPSGSGTGGSMARFTVLGDYLYMVDDKDLMVYRITQPSTPEFVRRVTIGFGIETIFPFKNRLFIGSTTAVYFFSVEDPENPVRISQAIEPSVIRRCDPVVARDSVAFATLNTSGPCGGVQSRLVVYDIRNLENPLKRIELPLDGPFGLGYSDSALYVCDNSSGLRVFNISNTWNPIPGKVLTGADFRDVIPHQNYLYAWVNRGLRVYNIQNQMDPQLVTEIN